MKLEVVLVKIILLGADCENCSDLPYSILPSVRGGYAAASSFPVTASLICCIMLASGPTTLSYQSKPYESMLARREEAHHVQGEFPLPPCISCRTGESCRSQSISTRCLRP